MRISICANLVGEHIPNAKLPSPKVIGLPDSGKKIFERFLPYMGNMAIMRPKQFAQSLANLSNGVST